MAKMLTRTITTYTYTYGVFDPSTMSVKDMETVTVPYKMGDREKRKRAVNGKLLLAESESTALYGMTIEDFVKYAKPIDGTDGN